VKQPAQRPLDGWCEIATFMDGLGVHRTVRTLFRWASMHMDPLPVWYDPGGRVRAHREALARWWGRRGHLGGLPVEEPAARQPNGHGKAMA